jgi:DNA modification methylase
MSGETLSSKPKLSAFCQTCGAWRGALGLEPSPELYIAHLIAIFREVRRVLQPQGTLWVNLGDSYVTKPHGYGPSTDPKYPAGRDRSRRELGQGRCNRPEELLGLKSKDLLMLPARAAIALQADGWYLRQMIPWLKHNGMPESTTDRPTSMCEYFFQFSREESYFYDREAVRIAGATTRTDSAVNFARATKEAARRICSHRLDRKPTGNTGTRARRNTDWLFSSLEDYSRNFHGMVHQAGDPLSMIVNPEPFSIEMCRACETCYQQREYRKLAHVDNDPKQKRVCACGAVDWTSHFATFPVKLIEPIVLAATSEKGACNLCGAMWERILEKPGTGDWHPDPANKQKAGAVNGTAKWAKEAAHSRGARVIRNVAAARAAGNEHENPFPAPQTSGWRPTCSHELFPHEPVPCVVLDPFGGSGRTAIAALKHGRAAIIIERNPLYLKMAAFQIEHTKHIQVLPAADTAVAAAASIYASEAGAVL